MLGAPTSPPGVRGDELTDAKARAGAAQEGRRGAEGAGREAQRTPGRPLGRDQEHGQPSCVASTPTSTTVRSQDRRPWRSKIDVIKADYAELVAAAQEPRRPARRSWRPARSPRRRELAERKALLAERVRSAYDTDRTSLLESFLSGGTFTDLLAEMSYFIDVGEQDKALANQIAIDQETLAALHQTTEDTRVRTNELRQETAAQKRALDASLVDLKDAKAELKKLEKRTAAALAAQKRTYQRLARNKAAAAAIIREAAAKQKRLAKKINALIAEAGQSRQHPVRVQRHAALADGQLHGQRRLRLQLVRVLRAGQRLRPLSQRDRPGRPEQLAGQGRRGRDRRLRRLELGGRPGPGLDRGHRPLEQRAARGTPTCSRPGRSPSASTSRRARSSASRAAPATRPARTCTGWSSSTAAS